MNDQISINDPVMIISVGDYTEIESIIGKVGTVIEISSEHDIPCPDDTYVDNEKNDLIYIVELSEYVTVTAIDTLEPMTTKYIGFERHELMLLKGDFTHEEEVNENSLSCV